MVFLGRKIDVGHQNRRCQLYNRSPDLGLAQLLSWDMKCTKMEARVKYDFAQLELEHTQHFPGKLNINNVQFSSQRFQNAIHNM